MTLIYATSLLLFLTVILIYLEEYMTYKLNASHHEDIHREEYMITFLIKIPFSNIRINYILI